MNNIGTNSNYSIKNLGTHSQLTYNKTMSTQSSLDTYINAKTEIAKNAGLTYTPFARSLTYSYATHSHVEVNSHTHSFSDKKISGLVKSFGTHSLLSEKINKGITHSHPALHFTEQTIEFKTQSNIFASGLTMSNNKFSYQNTNLIKGTNSIFEWKASSKIAEQKPLSINAMLHYQSMNGITNSIIATESHSNLGLTRSGHGMMSKKINNSGTFSVINYEKKFYAQPNHNTQKIENQSFASFLEKLTTNVQGMLKTENVTVNNKVITDVNYSLKSGDVVRVGPGHYINNSKSMAIVK